LSTVFVDRQTERLARELAALTNETVRETIQTALRERLQRERLKHGQFGVRKRIIREIAKECAALPDFDTRTPDEIIGYDENGMW